VRETLDHIHLTILQIRVVENGNSFGRHLMIVEENDLLVLARIIT